jgi:hypothetical protein
VQKDAQEEHQLDAKENVVVILFGLGPQHQNAARRNNQQTDSLRNAELIYHVRYGAIPHREPKQAHVCYQDHASKQGNA